MAFIRVTLVRIKPHRSQPLREQDVEKQTWDIRHNAILAVMPRNENFPPLAHASILTPVGEMFVADEPELLTAALERLDGNEPLTVLARAMGRFT